jgi:hypothetical protein
MKTLSASVARANLYKLLDEAASSHEPIQIAGTSLKDKELLGLHNFFKVFTYPNHGC